MKSFANLLSTDSPMQSENTPKKWLTIEIATILAAVIGVIGVIFAAIIPKVIDYYSHEEKATPTVLEPAKSAANVQKAQTPPPPKPFVPLPPNSTISLKYLLSLDDAPQGYLSDAQISAKRQLAGKDVSFDGYIIRKEVGVIGTSYDLEVAPDKKQKYGLVIHLDPNQKADWDKLKLGQHIYFTTNLDAGHMKGEFFGPFHGYHVVFRKEP